MKNRTFVLLLLYSSTLFISCGRGIDPLNNIQFGKKDYEEILNSLLINKVLTPNEDNDDKFKRYHYKIDGRVTSVSLNTDSYYFGKLRDLAIYFYGDSGFNDNKVYFTKGRGPRAKEEVDKIYDIYVKWYGEPDSIHKPLSEINPITNTPMHSYQIAYWNLPNFDLSFYRPDPTTFGNTKNLVYENASVHYSMYNYETTLENIQDSIRKLYKPNNLIAVNVGNLVWKDIDDYPYNKKLNFELMGFTKLGKEEKRAITAVKFDVIIMDEFGEELAKIEDLTEKFQFPLFTNHAIDKIITYSIKYNSFSSKYSGFEKARIISSRNYVKARAEIKSVIFEDGNVLI